MRIVTVPRDLAPSEIALRANLALAQGLLFRSSRVRIDLLGTSRPVVRQAKLGGLICDVQSSGAGITLEISGPYSLFRRTLVYGRNMAGLIPTLAWTDRFDLDARCHISGLQYRLRIRSGDPIFPRHEPQRFDSRIEERFFRDFSRSAPEWTVVREPIPARAGARLIFPAFLLQHRCSDRRWYLEILGFWTAEYLERKLRDYRAAKLSRLILCINDERCCADGDLPEARIVRFRRRIDAAEILRVIENELAR